MKTIKVIFSAGGTGGHIFPALATANKLKELYPDVDIRFVGAEGKMEMKKIPNAGYPITGLPVMGFPRKPSFKIFKFFGCLRKALRRSERLVRDFEPHVAAGFGGYASGPVLRVAGKRSVPYIIQEQNSYAGITNRLLSKKAQKICVAYPNMERFFPAEKIIVTGNPVRSSLVVSQISRKEACKSIGIACQKKVVFVTGGSLGARSLNEAVYKNIGFFKEHGIQLLWQCGSLYFKEFSGRLGFQVNDDIILTKFVENMDHAYAVADVVVARAGAGTIAELCIMGKPSIFVPSPNVAEDHQTHNAKALADKNAAILLPDRDAKDGLVEKIELLLDNPEVAEEMSKNMKSMAFTNADELIAKEILKLAGVSL
ncbi:MAG: undecaprenyldiphospho-muramoylpentapeptide beta-N-acetylglucosaminyltransferase [Salinivirgaceae bacterium]|jgi:UDP-N-acetylglucosamine--N-acetylmuramyl-(pentapeptide) pyrophosphoryl-undecaprenol N-acetylglucosamine transferase|nr:undecaprenyldiphospho-muramoylpentapeptide beta-N-acetylglucosaminyltransferase [Salinivirgaceae bacterium]